MRFDHGLHGEGQVIGIMDTGLDLDALIVTFGLANLVAAIPITPGGLGYVDAAYLGTLVGFGLSSSNARLGIASYRLAQFFLPIVLGAVASRPLPADRAAELLVG